MLTEMVRTEGARAGANLKGSVVKAGARYRSEQGSDYDPGVSAETVGSRVLFLGVVTLPPGARTRAHVHERHETALYAALLLAKNDLKKHFGILTKENPDDSQ